MLHQVDVAVVLQSFELVLKLGLVVLELQDLRLAGRLFRGHGGDFILGA